MQSPVRCQFSPVVFHFSLICNQPLFHPYREAIITGSYSTLVNPLTHRSLVICKRYLRFSLQTALLPSY